MFTHLLHDSVKKQITMQYTDNKDTLIYVYMCIHQY